MYLNVLKCTAELSFYSGAHPVQDQWTTWGKGLQNQKHSLCGYVWNIMLNSRHEHFTIIVIRKGPFWASIPWIRRSGYRVLFTIKVLFLWLYIWVKRFITLVDAIADFWQGFHGGVKITTQIEESNPRQINYIHLLSNTLSPGYYQVSSHPNYG